MNHHLGKLTRVSNLQVVISDVIPAEESDIDAVLFDWGGVLTDLPSIVVPRVMEEFGVRQIPREERTDDALERFHQLERGEIDLGVYLASARVANPGSERLWDPDDEAFVFPRLLPRPEVVESVAVIRACGYRTALVSNNVAEYWTWVLGTLDVDRLFDATINSAHVGHRKPEPAIYRLALEALGVSPDRALFLDDNEENVAAAADIGMRVVHVTASDADLFEAVKVELTT